MCFVWHLTAGLTMRNIAAWLSKHSEIGPSMGNPISPLKDLSHAACHLVLASSMYSASPTDNATIFCHWDAQDIALFAIKKTCPDVEWQSSLFSPQSESEYLINLASELPLYSILSSFVPLRYWSTYLAYLICSCVGLLLNHDNLVAANVISGLVPMAAYIQEFGSHLMVPALILLQEIKFLQISHHKIFWSVGGLHPRTDILWIQVCIWRRSCLGS